MVANPKSKIQNPKLAGAHSIASLIAFVALVLAIVLGIGVWIVHSRSGRPSMHAAMSAEERAYLQHIVISDAKVSAATNFLGDMVTYVDAKVTNTGTGPVRQLDLSLEFSDMLNQVVLRETAHPITSQAPPLRPGETRGFRVTLERMPVEWNQAPPAITAVGLHF